ncbi:MAG TPA: hypothetical protein VKD91_17285, partial [Pyrinomonadaceae bacterium]|nr:hypothetical protein [Pyrinomonadaceae bacterium]
MKRCPECEFLYYDDQDHCDMDGTRLLFTTSLPPRPDGTAPPPKSAWGTLMIPVLATLVLGAVLFTLYRPSPRAVNPPPVPQTNPASQKVPEPSKESPLPASDSSQPSSSPAGSPGVTETSADPFATPRTKQADATSSAD